MSELVERENTSLDELPDFSKLGFLVGVGNDFETEASKPLLEVEGGENQQFYTGVGFTICDYHLSIYGTPLNPKALLGFNYVNTTDGFDQAENVYLDTRLLNSMIDYFKELGLECTEEDIEYGEFEDSGTDECGSVFVGFNLSTKLIDQMISKFGMEGRSFEKGFDMDFVE